MRLIDADALQKEYQKEHGKRLLLIDVAPTIDAVERSEYEKMKDLAEQYKFERDVLEESQSGWIPCSERLPNYREVVLISGFGDVEVAARDAVKEDGTDDFWDLLLDDATRHPRYVGAWMPLPEPYKEERR